MPIGLFVGLTTLDFIYLTPSIPGPNQKIVAIDSTTAAGGPATNAAMTFQWLGNHSRLLSAIGKHPSSEFIRSDLANLELVDLLPDRLEALPTSSILVTESTGDRAVISVNATSFQATQFPMDILQGVDVVLIDGHQMAVSAAIASLAKVQGIPVVIDCGSWKAGFETVLVYADYAICSTNFLPPDCQQYNQVFDFLSGFKISFVAITQGSDVIVYLSQNQLETISVPIVKVVDTLGAGDIFHGAFCHFILGQDFPTALANAAKSATRSCQSFGTRSWLSESNYC